MIPFFEVNRKMDCHIGNSPEDLLAREMGRPPFPVTTLAGVILVREWASELADGRIGLIFDPYFWFAKDLWRKWIGAVEADSGISCGLDAPLGNQNPAWRTGLHVPLYATLRQLENAARQTVKNPLWIGQTVTSASDCIVVIVKSEMLRAAPEELQLSDLPKFWADSAMSVRLFCRGWLHAFGAVAEEGCREDLLAMTDWRGRVLELGCGAGRMARRCREMGNSVWWMGVDRDAGCLRQAGLHVDASLRCDLNAGLPLADNVRFDRIVCADVLEHLSYPWRLLADLRHHIHDDGFLVASFPNIGHWSAIEDLLSGRWDETPSGLCCVSHLRFGTKTTWNRWLQRSGWEPVHWEEERFPMPAEWHSFIDHCPVPKDFDALETLRYRVLSRPG